MTSTETATETKDALWQAILGKVEEVKKSAHGWTGGASRSQAFYTADGRSCMAVLNLDLADGTRNVFIMTARLPIPLLGGAGITVGVQRSCHSWDETWEDRIGEQHPRAVIVDHKYYTVGDEKARGPRDCRGFAGRRFTLEHLGTGEQSATSNLWYGGVVPPVFRDRLPDTHRFVTAEAGPVPQEADR